MTFEHRTEGTESSQPLTRRLMPLLGWASPNAAARIIVQSLSSSMAATRTKFYNLSILRDHRGLRAMFSTERFLRKNALQAKSAGQQQAGMPVLPLLRLARRARRSRRVLSR